MNKVFADTSYWVALALDKINGVNPPYPQAKSIGTVKFLRPK